MTCAKAWHSNIPALLLSAVEYFVLEHCLQSQSNKRHSLHDIRDYENEKYILIYMLNAHSRGIMVRFQAEEGRK